MCLFGIPSNLNSKNEAGNDTYVYYFLAWIELGIIKSINSTNFCKTYAKKNNLKLDKREGEKINTFI